MLSCVRGLCLAACLALPAVSHAVDVPPFTPNVVDPGHLLGAEDTEAINEALKRARAEADIWGAVFIVDTLDGDSLEDLAERAFREWKLGEKKKDNGLLLLLAMKDRKSRFEVGYGLEGDLPDAVARRALDDVLRPRMREGRTKDAIIDAFAYLQAVREKDAVLEKSLVAGPVDDDRLNVKRGLLGYYLFLFCLWIAHPFGNVRRVRAAQRLAADCPAYQIAKDKSVDYGRITFRGIFGRLSLRIFVSLNPGIFIFMGSGFNERVFALFGGVLALLSLVFLGRIPARYRSAADYQSFVEKERKKNARLVKLGYMKEDSPGHFTYTPAYYSSSEYKASQSSSSSGSSSSGSSSGGGSSGGGGSSSSW